MTTQNNDSDDTSDDSVEQAAERAFRNLADSAGGGTLPEGEVPSDPNDDSEVPAHSSVSAGLNSTSADPVIDEDDDDRRGDGGRNGDGSQ